MNFSQAKVTIMTVGAEKINKSLTKFRESLTKVVYGIAQLCVVDRPVEKAIARTLRNRPGVNLHNDSGSTSIIKYHLIKNLKP